MFKPVNLFPKVGEPKQVPTMSLEEEYLKHTEEDNNTVIDENLLSIITYLNKEQAKHDFEHELKRYNGI